MKPPFKITSKIATVLSEITMLLGKLDISTLSVPSPNLRRKNKIRTLKSTLAIEGHTFTEEQITALLEGKRVLGSKKEILEVHNANNLYESIDNLKSSSETDFLKAHKILMKGLLLSAGRYRSKNVGVLKGNKVKHLAPKPNFVPKLMGEVFDWIRKEKELHPLILSAVVHYEVEFIHPFEDGNGRIGRFWQGLILNEYNSLFKYVPVESLIEKNQKKYYSVLEKSDKKGESTVFIEFMLEIIKNSLEELSSEIISVVNTSADRIHRAKKQFKNQLFTRKKYLEIFKTISTATASRDLKEAVDKKILKKIGEKNRTRYKFL